MRSHCPAMNILHPPPAKDLKAWPSNATFEKVWHLLSSAKLEIKLEEELKCPLLRPDCILDLHQELDSPESMQQL